jgi:hypothetical protein
MRADTLAKLKAALDGLYGVIAQLVPADPVTPPPVATPQKLAVVSYIYPSNTVEKAEQWAAICAQGNLCILNPSSGPGTTASPDYVAQMARCKAAGILVAGYVTSNYRDVGGVQDDGVARHTTANVKAEIDRLWVQYGIINIFIDEMNTGGSPADLSYYNDLYAHVKTRGGLVIHNPGTRFPESYMALGDIFMSSETSASSYRTRTANPWEKNYPANRFWHCVHDVTEAEMPEMVALSKQRNAGWFYACGPVYSALPTYFTALAAKVKS